MRWGKRNGPPYPLSASNHSASEKKRTARKEEKDADNFHLTNKQKKYLKIGAGAIAASLATYGTLRLRVYGVEGLLGVAMRGKQKVEEMLGLVEYIDM